MAEGGGGEGYWCVWVFILTVPSPLLCRVTGFFTEEIEREMLGLRGELWSAFVDVQGISLQGINLMGSCRGGITVGFSSKKP